MFTAYCHKSFYISNLLWATFNFHTSHLLSSIIEFLTLYAAIYKQDVKISARVWSLDLIFVIFSAVS